MSNERLGLVEEAQQRAAVYSRFAYRAPSSAAKVHTINVDCRTGQRTVDSGPPPPATPDAAKLAKPRPIEIRERPPRRFGMPNPDYTVRQILEAVAEAYRVTLFSLLSKNNRRRVAQPRFAAAKLLRDKRKMSYPRIAFSLRRADHSTAIHECARADELLANDPEWAADYHAAELALCRK